MSYEQLHDLYNNWDSVRISMLVEMIDNAENEEEKAFFTDLCNLILKYRQKECIANGKF